MRFLTRIVVLVGVAVLLGLGANAARRAGNGGLPWVDQSTRGDVYEKSDAEEAPAFIIDLAKAMELYNEDVAFFLDAREPDHYAEGHIYGAHNFPADQILDRADELMEAAPTLAPVVIYCGGGNCEDSYNAYDHLKGIGYEELYVYKAGWEEWGNPENKLPVAIGATPAGDGNATP